MPRILIFGAISVLALVALSVIVMGWDAGEAEREELAPEVQRQPRSESDEPEVTEPPPDLEDLPEQEPSPEPEVLPERGPVPEPYRPPEP